MKKLILYFFILISPLLANKKEIVVWNYYNSIPFVVNKSDGLAKDFVELLNKYSKKNFKFKLVNIPRERLNKHLEANIQGLVLFVNPKWMGKNAKNKYFWTKAILEDQNEIISANNKKINFDNINTFQKLSFVGIRGRNYKSLNKLIDEKNLDIHLVNKENQALFFLALNRADFTTQPKTIALPLIEHLGLKNKVYIAKKPLFKFTRHIMIAKEDKELQKFLIDFVDKLHNKKEWEKLLIKYHLKSSDLK